MLVCHCKAVPERRIRAEAVLGAASVDEVGDRCGAGTDCGGCRPVIEEILDETTLGFPRRVAAVA